MLLPPFSVSHTYMFQIKQIFVLEKDNMSKYKIQFVADKRHSATTFPCFSAFYYYSGCRTQSAAAWQLAGTHKRQEPQIQDPVQILKLARYDCRYDCDAAQVRWTHFCSTDSFS